tara:strand:- start:41434 stop:41796 length:363 start_codon:yes stop_codon:yes gene_type:complete
MKISKLAGVIRKIVKEEVQKEVRNILSEKKVKRVPQSINIDAKKTLTLTEALNHTEAEAYPVAKTFTSEDARAGFAAMQDGVPNALTGHNGQLVPTDKVDPSLTKAITRDYSELVKRFKK